MERLGEKKVNIWLYISILLIIYITVNTIVNTNKVYIETSDIVAVVNGDEIFEGDVYNAYLDYRGGVVEFLIQDKALEQKAKEMDIEIASDDVEKEFNLYKESFETDEDFKKYLEDVKLTENGIKRNIKRELLIENIRNKLGEDVEVSEEEIKERFEYSPESYINIDLDFIEIKDKDKLDEIYEYALENGVEGLKEKYKDHIGIIDTREDIGVFDNYFGEYVVNSKVGDVYKRGSEDGDSFLIIVVKDKKETYDDLKEKIKEQIVLEVSDTKFEDLVQELTEDIDVEYRGR